MEKNIIRRTHDFVRKKIFYLSKISLSVEPFQLKLKRQTPLRVRDREAASGVTSLSFERVFTPSDPHRLLSSRLGNWVKVSRNPGDCFGSPRIFFSLFFIGETKMETG